jgi:hypothetical protein
VPISRIQSSEFNLTFIKFKVYFRLFPISNANELVTGHGIPSVGDRQRLSVVAVQPADVTKSDYVPHHLAQYISLHCHAGAVTFSAHRHVS